MSLTSVDLPEPLPPVTAVSTPSGILTSMLLRLFARAPLMIRSPFIDGRRPFGVGIDFAPVRYAAVSEAHSAPFEESLPARGPHPLTNCFGVRWKVTCPPTPPASGPR